MKIYQGNTIPVRTQPNQYGSFYGVVVGFNAALGAVLVKNRDNGDKTEIPVVFKQDEKGTWWETVKQNG